MANITDPLVAAVHGTDPQNLMEYITRQKIYDSRYWKEECFGLSAVEVLEKASRLKAIGGSFGGNMQPTKFLCLTLKMLQIQPEDELVDELVSNEDFKYVRALGAFYKRLSGRPAGIYESLEPLYRDYRKLRYREVAGWSLLHMDEFVHSLLTEERVCGIALPRLPRRSVLEEAGYLEEGPRPTALADVMEGGPLAYLLQKVEQGSEAAKRLYEERQQKAAKEEEKQQQRETQRNSNRQPEEQQPRDDRRGQKRHREDERHCDRNRDDEMRRGKANREYYSDFDDRRRLDRVSHRRPEDRHRRNDHADSHHEDSHGRQDRGYPSSDGHRRNDRGYSRDDGGYRRDNDRDHPRDDDRAFRRDNDRGYAVEDRSHKKDKGDKEEKRYGTLFKKEKKMKRQDAPNVERTDVPVEGSDEYWNEQRAKLGLKPLKK